MLARKTIPLAAIFSFIAIVTGIVAFKTYTRPHRSVENEAAIAATAIELFDAFERDEAAANIKYLDKVVEVSGTVLEITNNVDNQSVIMFKTDNGMFGVRCTMQDSLVSVKTGRTATIRGICTGYLSDVVITNGIVIK